MFTQYVWHNRYICRKINENPHETNRTSKNGVADDRIAFSGAIVLQIVGMSLFPLTAGYTKFWPTLASILALLLGSSLFCRMLYKGVALSFLIPLGSAVIPLVVSMLGIFVYEESISALKITLLIVACALIGIAGKMK